MKLKSLRRFDVLKEIVERVDGNVEFTPAKVIRKDDLVSRAYWAGDKLIIILEQARKVVGYNLFSKSQSKRATRYTQTFLEKKQILWQRTES